MEDYIRKVITVLAYLAACTAIAGAVYTICKMALFVVRGYLMFKL